MSNIVRVTKSFALQEAAMVLLRAQSKSLPTDVLVAFSSAGHAWATLAAALSDHDFIEVDRSKLPTVEVEYGRTSGPRR